MAKNKQDNLKSFDPTLELGATGLRQNGGMVDEEFLKNLSGQKGIKVYKEMSENDSTVGAILFTIDMLIRQVVWKIQEASQDQADMENAQFLRECMDDMSHTWSDLITEILSMLPFGFSWHEIVYKQRLGDNLDPSKRSKFKDGRIGWRKMPIRSQDTLFQWIFDTDGGIKGFHQLDTYTGVNAVIPIEKSLLFRTRSRKNNPEGISILRTAYRPYYFKKNIENLEGIGIERDLAGLPVMYVPPQYLSQNATAEQKQFLNEIKRIVTSVKRDEQEGLVLPSAYDENNNKLFDFQLVNSGGSRQFNTTEIIRRYDQAIATSVLADFILLGHEKVGSFALASSKTAMFSQAIGAWLTSIADTFNRHAIPRLFKLNGIQCDRYPILTHSDIETVDLGELGAYISALSGAGMNLFPDDKLEAYLKSQANLPIDTTKHESL